jgi:hypothetical protein
MVRQSRNPLLQRLRQVDLLPAGLHREIACPGRAQKSEVEVSNVGTPQRTQSSAVLPNIIAHGAEQTAPAGGTVLADSGAVANPGTYRVLVSFATTDTAANIIQIVRRNAANAADVELADGASGVLAGGSNAEWAEAFFVLALNERVVVRNKNAGTTALFYQANIALFLMS